MRQKKRKLISTGEDLAKLLRSEPNPTIYVDHENVEEDNLEQVAEDVYIPSVALDDPESSGHGYNTQSTQYDEGIEAIERYASLNWLGGDEETASQG